MSPAASTGTSTAARTPAGTRTRARERTRAGAGRLAVLLGAVVLLVLAWEGYKAVGPVDGASVAGVRVLPRADDRAMPHVGEVLAVLGTQEVSTPGSRTVGAAVAAGIASTLGLALLGGFLGAAVGLGLAVLMQRLRLLESGLLPWVVLSQTVPIVAIAPLVTGWGGAVAIGAWSWTPQASVVVIAAFLAFSPVAVGALRGLQSPAPAAVELFRSYAVPWRAQLLHLRLPAARPFLVPALRLAGAQAVVGAIVAEISTGTRGGIGRLVIEYAQQATSSPARVYAAILGAVVLGLVVATLLTLADRATAARPARGVVV